MQRFADLIDYLGAQDRHLCMPRLMTSMTRDIVCGNIYISSFVYILSIVAFWKQLLSVSSELLDTTIANMVEH